PAKVRQLHAYGADVVLVPGPRSAATDSAQEAASGGRGIYASHLWSPLFLAGTATFAWEAWEQLGRTVPDAVVVPLGGGTLLLGAWRGFAALRDAGLASRAPRLYGVQSTACEPLATAFRSGGREPGRVTAEDPTAPCVGPMKRRRSGITRSPNRPSVGPSARRYPP